LLSVPRVLENAGSAAKTIGIPDAASRLADIVSGLIPINSTTDYGRSE
jgi:hypothetical protein